MIAIIDYQMGNLRSVQKGFEKVGHAGHHHQRPGGAGPRRQGRAAGRGRVWRCDGRAASGANWSSRFARRSPRASRFWASAWVCNCCSTSATKGARTEGLGIVPGEVVRFELPPEYKVPHMGWNQLCHSRRRSRWWPVSRTGVLLLRALVLCRAQGPRGDRDRNQLLPRRSAR